MHAYFGKEIDIKGENSFGLFISFNVGLQAMISV